MPDVNADLSATQLELVKRLAQALSEVDPDGWDDQMNCFRAQARVAIEVVQGPIEPASSGCALCDRGVSVSTKWGGRKHVSGTKAKGQHFADCTAS